MAFGASARTGEAGILTWHRCLDFTGFLAISLNSHKYLITGCIGKEPGWFHNLPIHGARVFPGAGLRARLCRASLVQEDSFQIRLAGYILLGSLLAGPLREQSSLPTEKFATLVNGVDFCLFLQVHTFSPKSISAYYTADDGIKTPLPGLFSSCFSPPSAASIF